MKRSHDGVKIAQIGDLPDDRLIWHRDTTAAVSTPDISAAGLTSLLPARVSDPKAPRAYDLAQLNKACPVLGAQNMALQLWGIHSTPASSPNDLTGTIYIITWARRIREGAGYPRGRYGLEIDFKIGTENALAAATEINPIDGSAMTGIDVRACQLFTVANGTADGAKHLPYDLYDSDESDGNAVLRFDPMKAEYVWVGLKTKGANLGRILVSLQHMGG